MSDGSSSAAPVEAFLVETDAALGPLVERAGRAERLALDVEGNGLFAYRSSLCTVQLAWEEEGGGACVAVVDTLAIDPRGLAHLLGASGPTKVLHDLGFDARQLAESGVELGRVRDTSIAARMLGHASNGLATMLASELGVTVDKSLQQHDWGRRPLGARELRYLQSDVRWLPALDRALAARAEAAGISEEIDEETRHRLATSLAPAREKKPGWLRTKGAEGLDTLGLAVLRRVWEARERAAEASDVPPFHVAGAEVLVGLARSRPSSRSELSAVRGAMRGRSASLASAWLAAVALGIADGAPPAEDVAPPPRVDRATIAARKAREARLSAWRRVESAARGVDPQVVVPGHCVDDLASGAYEDLDALARVPGLGAKRLALYGEKLVELVRGDPPPPASG